MEKVLEILKELHPEVDFNTCTTLIDDNILDSLRLKQYKKIKTER